MVSGSGDPEYGKPYQGVQVQASSQGDGATGPQGPAGPAGPAGPTGPSGGGGGSGGGLEVHTLRFSPSTADLFTGVTLATLEDGDALVFAHIRCITAWNNTLNRFRIRAPGNTGNTGFVVLDNNTVSHADSNGSGMVNPTGQFQATLSGYTLFGAVTTTPIQICVTATVPNGILTANNPPALPLTVETGVNDQFEESGFDAFVAAGTYSTVESLAAVLADAINVVEDAPEALVAGSNVGGKVVLTWHGSNGAVLNSGSGDDILADTGIDDGQTFTATELPPTDSTAGLSSATIGVYRGYF